MNIKVKKMEYYSKHIKNMINLKKALVIIVIVLSALSCNRQSNKIENNPGKPNILWIVADDLGTDLGCYGDSLIYTPNLDKLDNVEVKYNHFYTVTAVCSPSRSNMITGMYPTSINCHQHRTRYKNPLPDGIYLVTKYFKNAGYFTSTGSLNLNVYYQFNYEPKKDSVS